jgi:site-specific DNA-cytosine methylase
MVAQIAGQAWLLCKKQRFHFDGIYELLTAEGFKLDWRLLNAWDYGVAQTRERVFYGSLSAQYRQVGNAVPPKLAYQLAMQIALAFREAGRW